MVIHRFQPLYSMASSIAHVFFLQEANTICHVHLLMSRAWRHLDVTHVPLVNQVRDLFFIKSKKWFFTLQLCVFLDFWDARGLGLLFMVCDCAAGPRDVPFVLQVLLSIKLCEKCGSNSCVGVFFIPWGHVNSHDHIWAFVTSMGSPDLNARFWLVETIFAALWLVSTY